MKRISLLIPAFILFSVSFAQRTIKLKTLWTPPRVHVLFQNYSISFSAKDISKAIELLHESGDSVYKLPDLDPDQNYYAELQPGLRTEYHNTLQPVLQRGVGVFLLLSGHAYIENHRHKKVAEIIADIQPLIEGTDRVNVLFYDAHTRRLLFSGDMLADLYNKDIGIQ